jgi:hypothetical protein
MTNRTPQSRDRRFRSSQGAPVDLTAAVETPVERYPLRRGGKAVPDRSREPVIGVACHDTDFVGPAPRVDPNTNAGPEIGPTENAKTRQEHGDAVRESRGVRTRPVRPGQHA